MQYYNNTLCISYGELVGKSLEPNVVGENGFISRYDYINLSKRKKLVSVRRGSRGTEALYDFETLPMQIKSAVAAKYKDVVKKAQQEPVKNFLQPDYKALGFFSKYTLPNGEHLKENTIREYTATAAALNAIINLTSDTKAWRKALGGSANQSGSLKTLIEVLATFQPKWGWKLPAGERAMRDKINKYKAGGYESLISGKLCNDNAAKIVEDEQEAALRRIMALGRNLDDVQVMKLYNMTAEAAGWKKITKGTVANKRSEWQIYTDAGSRGKINHDNVHAMQVKRRAPQAPLLYWTVDGWDVELLYQKTATNSKGHNVTTYHNRMTTVIVLDPCEKYPIGYAIGTHETPDLIRQALRNAVKHTAELFGQMHQVYQLQTDNYGKKALLPFYEAISEVYTPARVKNAKAKVIEPYFKHLNKNHCQLKPNWSGFGVTARKENQPNAEYLNNIRHTFPDEKGCFMQIVEMIEAERRLKVEKYKAAYQNLTEDKKLILSPKEFLFRLGETSGATNKLAGNGINLQVNRQKFVFDTFDPLFRSNRNEAWTIKYDPEDMTQALAANSDASLQFILESKHIQPMALAERSAGDSEALSKVRRYNEALVEDILNVQEQDYQALGRLYDRNPRIEETLGKLLLTDSNGQHKDQRNEARLMQNAQKLEMKSEANRKNDSQAAATSKREAYLHSQLDISKFLNDND